MDIYVEIYGRDCEERYLNYRGSLVEEGIGLGHIENSIVGELRRGII